MVWCRYYHSALHEASFVLPNFMVKLINGVQAESAAAPAAAAAAAAAAPAAGTALPEPPPSHVDC